MADERSKDDPLLILNPTRQAEKRINSIIRFTRRQRRKRRWINIHEIAEWYAERSGRFDVAEQDRAYDMHGAIYSLAILMKMADRGCGI